LRNEILSKRLVEITKAATQHLHGGSRPKLLRLFGTTDSDKFIEVMTFFAACAAEHVVTSETRDVFQDQFDTFLNGLKAANGGLLHDETMTALHRLLINDQLVSVFLKRLWPSTDRKFRIPTISELVATLKPIGPVEPIYDISDNSLRDTGKVNVTGPPACEKELG
jgi:hypothetical protein